MNNKGADQTAQMPRLVCAFVVRKTLKIGYVSRPTCRYALYVLDLNFQDSRDYVANWINQDLSLDWSQTGKTCLPLIGFLNCLPKYQCCG